MARLPNALARREITVLNNKQEQRIKAFVKNGGVVIVSGQDSDEEKTRVVQAGYLNP